MSEENVTVVLHTPIQAYGEEVKELSFRPPTTADILEVGCPMRVELEGEEPRPIFDDRRFAQMMSRLASVPPSSIRMMHPRDFLAAQWALMSFFVPNFAGG